MKLDAELRKLAFRRAADIIRKMGKIEALARAVILQALDEAAGKQHGIQKAAYRRTGPRKPKVVNTVEGTIPASLNILKARGIKLAREPMAKVYTVFVLNKGTRWTPKEMAEHLKIPRKVNSVGKMMRKMAKAGILDHQLDGRYMFK